MDLLNNVWSCDRQQVIVTLEIRFPIFKSLATIVILVELVRLDHRAHCTIEQHDPFGQCLL